MRTRGAVANLKRRLFIWHLAALDKKKMDADTRGGCKLEKASFHLTSRGAGRGATANLKRRHSIVRRRGACRHLAAAAVGGELGVGVPGIRLEMGRRYGNACLETVCVASRIETSNN